MMRVRGSALASVLIFGLGAAVAGCGGGSSGAAAKASGTPHASSSPAVTTAQAASGGKPAQAPPKGYQWVGSSQAVWLAVPDSWIGLNLAKLTLNQAMKRFAVQGASQLSGSNLEKDLQAIRKQHGMMVADLASGTTSPHHFTTNINAFCLPTPLQLNGSAAPLISAIRTGYATIHPVHLSIKAITIQGSPAAEAQLTLSTTSGLLTDQQYVQVHDGKLCTVTMSTDSLARYGRTFAKIATTIQLPAG